jgi:hypothetical protein
MTSVNHLVLTRAADREALFAAVSAIAVRHGASVDRFDHDREIIATLGLDGAIASIGIEHLVGCPVPIISWVSRREEGIVLQRSFCVAVGDQPGARLHHKATSCPSDMDGVLADLDEGLALIAAGEAMTTREAASRTA